MGEKKSSFTTGILTYLILLAILIVFYPNLWDLISLVFGYPTISQPEAFLNWGWALTSSQYSMNFFAAAMVLLPIGVFMMMTSIGKSDLQKLNMKAYGSARWMTNDEFFNQFTTYDITADQATKTKFTLTRYFPTKSEAKEWEKKK